MSYEAEAAEAEEEVEARDGSVAEAAEISHTPTDQNALLS